MNTVHQRRIIVVAVSLASLATVDLLVRLRSSRLDEYYVDHYARKTRALDARADLPEILLLGSSRAAYALVPGEFEMATGRRAFNLAIPASKVLEWRLLAERVVPGVDPPLIVLGINASEIRADYEPVSAARDLFTMGDLVNCVAFDGWSNAVVGHYLERNAGAAWALFHRRYEMLSWLQESAEFCFSKHAQLARERRLAASRPSPGDGYEHPWLSNKRTRTLEEQVRSDPASVFAAGVPPFDENAPAVRHFRELLGWFKQRRMRVIVAYIPNSPRTETRWRAVEGRMSDAIERICREAGVPFIDADPSELPRTNADYFEETHMGLPLARRISRRIAVQSIQLGLLKPAVASERTALFSSETGESP